MGERQSLDTVAETVCGGECGQLRKMFQRSNEAGDACPATRAVRYVATVEWPADFQVSQVIGKEMKVYKRRENTH